MAACSTHHASATHRPPLPLRNTVHASAMAGLRRWAACGTQAAAALLQRERCVLAKEKGTKEGLHAAATAQAEKAAELVRQEAAIEAQGVALVRSRARVSFTCMHTHDAGNVRV